MQRVASHSGKIKQLFSELAKQIASRQDEGGRLNQRQPPLPTIRAGMIVSPELMAANALVVEKIMEISELGATWSASSVDDVVWEFTQRIVSCPIEGRDAAIRDEVTQVVKRFEEMPSSWVCDILIYGIDKSCGGISFGKVLFVEEEIIRREKTNSPLDLTQLPDFPSGTHIFARLQTTAIDEGSSYERAETVLDEHLMVLNALCSGGATSYIQVSRSNWMDRSYSMKRAGRSADSMGPMWSGGFNHRIPLTKDDFGRVMTGSATPRVSEMLASAETEFNRRLLLGYQFAGAACVDQHPERRFLMFAIALESVVLGKDTKSELTYQLGSRVAHLIGKGLDGRRTVMRTVNDLYDRRSKIVHTGQYGVSRRELALMEFYCMSVLGMLTVGPAFSTFERNKDLEDWFKDRVLDGPNHFDDSQPQASPCGDGIGMQKAH